MKRKLFNTTALKQMVLAVPAAALMLGAAQAGSTVGMNFMAWYYDSGTTPQTIGFGKGYQTTGWPVTAMAFGVPAANWYGTASPDLLNANFVAIANTYTFGPGGAMSATLTAPGVWQSGIGELVAGFVPETVTPGNDEVTWNYLTSSSTASPSVALAGLAAQFPNGYVVETIAAHSGVVNFNGVQFTDGVTTTHANYATYYEANPASDGYVTGGTIGLSGSSGMFTSDTLTINCDAQTTGSNSVLSGFIITDQPVVTRSVPSSLLLLSGTPFTLPPANIIGIGLSYQWQLNGTNLPGATFITYTNNGVTAAAAGLYQVVATSSYFPGTYVTGLVANISVVPAHPPQVSTWDANSTTAGAQDGAGTWAYANTNWWNGTLDDYWNPTDSAIFGVGGTGTYKVTLGDNITANAITFASAGYTITNSSSQTLTLQGAASITANAAAAITVPLSSGTNMLLKAGTGALTLSGKLASASTFVAAGSLEVLAKNGDSPYVVTNGATLKLGYSTGGGYANTAMSLYGDGTAATTGLYLKGGSTYNVSGTLSLLGAPTTIRQYGTGMAALGIFDINSTGLRCYSAASGSVIVTNVQLVNDGYGMAMQVDAGTNTATGDLVLNGPLSINAQNGIYGLVKRGAGSVRLNAVATAANCGLDIRAGSAICGIANCIGSNALLKVEAGTTFDFNGYSQTVTNATLAGNVKMTINKGASPSNVSLTVTGNPLNYGGALTLTNIGAPLAIGDSFTLFSSAGGYAGAFASITQPAQDGLAFQDNTLVDGSIKVIAGSIPPTITSDLSGATNYAYVGGKVTLTVAATGDSIVRYRWKLNGVTPVGTDSPTLTLTSLTLGSAGFYSVTVTNDYGVVQSQTNYLVVASPSPYVAVALQDGPQDFWPLNETNPATAFDYSGPNDGVQNGALVLGVAGPVSPGQAGFTAGTTAYGFDGASTYIDLGPGPALSGTTDFTIETWINSSATTASILMQQRYSAGYNGEYQIGLNANGTLSFTIYGGGAYQFSFSSTNTASPVNNGVWHHIAAVRSGANGYLYVDGNLVGAASGNPAPLDPTFRVYIGADMRNYNNYFNGSLCDLAIYTHALSSAQVANHAQTGLLGPPPTLTLSGKNLIWTSGTLVSSPVLGPSASWITVAGATSPYPLPPTSPTGPTMFYRLKR